MGASPRLAGVGRAPGALQGWQAQAPARTGMRSAEADRSRASGGGDGQASGPAAGSRQPATPRSSRGAPGGSAPGARASRPGKAARAAPWAAARGVGWGRAEHPLPPRTLGPSLEGTWRDAGRKRGTGEDATGRGQGWRPAGDGGAEGRAGRRRRAAFPPTPLCTPPLTSRGPSSPTTGQALGPTACPGHAAFQTSFPPYLPIPRRAVGGEARELGGAGRGAAGRSWNRPR